MFFFQFFAEFDCAIIPCVVLSTLTLSFFGVCVQVAVATNNHMRIYLNVLMNAMCILFSPIGFCRMDHLDRIHFFFYEIPHF